MVSAPKKQAAMAAFWQGKSVFMTGHTGFKGSWLSLWLQMIGARVTGFALNPPSTPSLFQLAGVENITSSITADIRDRKRLNEALQAAEPEIVIHMAAQPLVRESYHLPVETYTTNVMGTVNLLEAVRRAKSVRTVIIVTSDKCYENQETNHPFREDEPLGGYDPYSSSKACTELVTAAWRSSFFNPEQYGRHKVAIASVRAGNVIGGGDWAKDRLIPDFIRSLEQDESIYIRSPHAVRPWQHVLEPLYGYLMLARRLYEDGPEFSGAWNFGPLDSEAESVEWVVKRLCDKWGNGAYYESAEGPHPHEAGYLRLDISKAQSYLGWSPSLNLDQALDLTLDWVRAWQAGNNMDDTTREQIKYYMNML